MGNISQILANKYVQASIAILIIIAITIFIKTLLSKKHIEGNFTSWAFISMMIIFILNFFGDRVFMNDEIIRIESFVINLKFILIVTLAGILASKISQLLIVTLMDKIYKKYDVNENSRFTFNSIIKFILIVIVLIVSLNSLGLSLNSLAVFGSVLGVGLAFGLQNITSNFISGIILMFGTHIRIGDRLVVNNEVVDVERINFRATIVKSLEDKRIIVPNSYFLENSIVNLSHGSPITRLTLPIGVSYNSNVDEVERILMEVADEMQKQYSAVILNPKPFVYFKNFGDSSLDFELFLWTSDPKQGIKLRSAANFMIFKKLNENNIEIPFPQRDLHLKTKFTLD